MTDPAHSSDPIKLVVASRKEARGRMQIYQFVVNSDHEEDRALVTSA